MPKHSERIQVCSTYQQTLQTDQRLRWILNQRKVDYLITSVLSKVVGVVREKVERHVKLVTRDESA